MFEMKCVSQKYRGESALKNVTMTIGRGLNYIIGPSGSGKSTLLRILSGMEQSFDGEVFYCGKSMKSLTAKEKSYFYHHVFGFVWQDFHLQEHLTVMENVTISQYLTPHFDQESAAKVLQELKISELADQKVSKLSGGQKQRVAIARELVKNPQVMIADEPTSALDKKSARLIMEILKNIAKKRTVIIVTHDRSLIDPQAEVFELEKGELVSGPEPFSGKKESINMEKAHGLSLFHACRLALQNAKRGYRSFLIGSVTLFLAAAMLLVTVSGALSRSSQSAFDELFTTYGQNLLDIDVAGSFISAGGTDGQSSEKPDANVSQNISGLYESYQTDSRISHIVFSQAFNDIQITVEGKQQKIESSNNVPVINELSAGKMASGSGKEVVVPQSLVRKLGLSDQEALGKTINFEGAIYNWDSGSPELMPVSTQAVISGVMDTTVRYDAQGTVAEYSTDDAFFFSKSALDEMRTQAGIATDTVNFTIRAKTPADTIEIKNELNASGIVPLGRFELIEDMVRLNRQTARQSGSAAAAIALISCFAVLAVGVMTAMYRRREYAIYKISGFSAGQLAGMTAAEGLLFSSLASLLLCFAAPLINQAAKALWKMDVQNVHLLLTGVLLVFASGVLYSIVTALISFTAKESNVLKTGDR